jgi:hypothetical protein
MPAGDIAKNQDKSDNEKMGKGEIGTSNLRLGLCTVLVHEGNMRNRGTTKERRRRDLFYLKNRIRSSQRQQLPSFDPDPPFFEVWCVVRKSKVRLLKIG